MTARSATRALLLAGAIMVVLVTARCAHEGPRTPCRPTMAKPPDPYTGDLEPVPPQPRCARNDPGCGPIPYRQDRCIEDLYHPGRPRHPLGFDGRGACTHDGACTIVGCDQACGPTDEPDPIQGCTKKKRLPGPGQEASLCGCVDGLCAWFTEGR